MRLWVDFSDNEERLEQSVLIYTQAFNDLVGLADNEWGCFEVPKSQSTNGASWSPLVTFLLWLERRDPKIRLAALGHDYLYRSAGIKLQIRRFDKVTRTPQEKRGSIMLTRGQADWFIRTKAKDLGCNYYRRVMIHTGLQIGGWRSWRRYKKFNTK